MFCPLNQTQLLVMGGTHKGELLSDIVIVDVLGGKVRKSESSMAFECTANSVMVSEGSVYSLVSDDDGEQFFVHFSAKTDKVTIV